MNLADFGALSLPCNAPADFTPSEGVTRLQRQKFFQFPLFQESQHRMLSRSCGLFPAVIHDRESALASKPSTKMLLPPRSSSASAVGWDFPSRRSRWKCGRAIPGFRRRSRRRAAGHARDGDSPRRLSRTAAGTARCSLRSANLTTSIPISSVAATAVAIAQSSDDNGTVWNAVCRNGT